MSGFSSELFSTSDSNLLTLRRRSCRFLTPTRSASPEFPQKAKKKKNIAFNNKMLTIC